MAKLVSPAEKLDHITSHHKLSYVLIIWYHILAVFTLYLYKVFKLTKEFLDSKWTYSNGKTLLIEHQQTQKIELVDFAKFHR